MKIVDRIVIVNGHAIQEPPKEQPERWPWPLAPVMTAIIVITGTKLKKLLKRKKAWHPSKR